MSLLWGKDQSWHPNIATITNTCIAFSKLLQFEVTRIMITVCVSLNGPASSKDNDKFKLIRTSTVLRSHHKDERKQYCLLLRIKLKFKSIRTSNVLRIHHKYSDAMNWYRRMASSPYNYRTDNRHHKFILQSWAMTLKIVPLGWWIKSELIYNKIDTVKPGHIHFIVREYIKPNFGCLKIYHFTVSRMYCRSSKPHLPERARSRS